MRIKILAMIFCELIVSILARAADIPGELAARKIYDKSITAVIFDVNGVLLLRNTWTTIRSIDLTMALAASFNGRAIWRKEELFSKLKDVESHYLGPPLFHEGYELPGIMAEWQTGLISGTEALSKSQAALQDAVLPEILDIMFNPVTLAKVHEINPLALRLMETLRRYNIPIYILSNMDLKTARLLEKKFPEIFTKAQRIMWSAKVKLAKPDPLIFKLALAEFGLNAKNTLFIDDEQANRDSAMNLDIHAMKETDMAKLNATLEELH